LLTTPWIRKLAAFLHLLSLLGETRVRAERTYSDKGWMTKFPLPHSFFAGEIAWRDLRLFVLRKSCHAGQGASRATTLAR
jgi:hypothetical protein